LDVLDFSLGRKTSLRESPERRFALKFGS